MLSTENRSERRSVMHLRLFIVGLWKQGRIIISMAASRTSYLKIERAWFFLLCKCICQWLLLEAITTLDVKTISPSKMSLDLLHLASITVASLHVNESYLELWTYQYSHSGPMISKRLLIWFVERMLRKHTKKVNRRRCVASPDTKYCSICGAVASERPIVYTLEQSNLET